MLFPGLGPTAGETQMAYAEWKDDFSVGVALIDEDHKQLLLIISRLYEALVAGSGKAEEVCDELIAHTLEHFAHEEQWFGALHYPQAAQHRRMHQKLTERLTSYRRTLHHSVPSGVEDFALFVDFLGHHIAGADRTYGAWLNAQGIH